MEAKSSPAPRVLHRVAYPSPNSINCREKRSYLLRECLFPIESDYSYISRQTTGEGGRAINNKQTHAWLDCSEYDIRGVAGGLAAAGAGGPQSDGARRGCLPIRLSSWACSLGVQLSNQLDINVLVPCFSFKFVQAWRTLRIMKKGEKTKKDYLVPSAFSLP